MWNLKNVVYGIKNKFYASNNEAHIESITKDATRLKDSTEKSLLSDNHIENVEQILINVSENPAPIADNIKVDNDRENICKSKDIPDWLKEDLNTQQIEAVTSTEGYIRVIAGAGTGKTKALVYRYSYLVKEIGILPRNILCVTFTNKAANEMKARIRALIGDNDLGFICTFHSACMQILREDIYVLGYPKNFMILDTGDVESILKSVYDDVNLKTTNYSFKQAKDMIRLRKQGIKYIDLLLKDDWIDFKRISLNSHEIKDKVFYGYLYEQRKCFGLDFEDLLLFTLYLLENNNSVLNKWQQRFNYVMVDEFQDVSSAQYGLTNYLSDFHKNLFIVGDPDQTIYGWRGARVNFILDFNKNYPDCKTIILNQNYRSTSNILNVSNSLIEKNKKRIDKNLFTKNNHYEPVEYYHALSTKIESNWIAQTISDYLQNGIAPNSICILYRAHYISRNIEEALIDKNIPYKIYSGVEFYQRKEIKDILAYLRMLIYLDDLSFLRIINEPKRGCGKKRIEYLKEFALTHKCTLYTALKENIKHSYFASEKFSKFIKIIDFYSENYSTLKISDLLSELLLESGYESMLMNIGDQDRLDNISELKQSVFDYEMNQNEECSLEDYLSHIALFTNMDKKDLLNAVKLMTIHSSKGLEFPIVFVCGLNEGIFPGKRVDTIEKLEEERRLAYVAFTRAKEKLFLSDAEGFNYDNSFRHPSRFILNVDDKLIKYIIQLSEYIKHSALFYIKNNENLISREIFNPGDVITHPNFGKGQIDSVIDNLGYIITFDKLPVPRTISFNAPLKKV